MRRRSPAGGSPWARRAWARRGRRDRWDRRAAPVSGTARPPGRRPARGRGLAAAGLRGSRGRRRSPGRRPTPGSSPPTAPSSTPSPAPACSLSGTPSRPSAGTTPAPGRSGSYAGFRGERAVDVHHPGPLCRGRCGTRCCPGRTARTRYGRYQLAGPGHLPGLEVHDDHGAGRVVGDEDRPRDSCGAPRSLPGSATSITTSPHVPELEVADPQRAVVAGHHVRRRARSEPPRTEGGRGGRSPGHASERNPPESSIDRTRRPARSPPPLPVEDHELGRGRIVDRGPPGGALGAVEPRQVARGPAQHPQAPVPVHGRGRHRLGQRLDRAPQRRQGLAVGHADPAPGVVHDVHDVAAGVGRQARPGRPR